MKINKFNYVMDNEYLKNPSEKRTKILLLDGECTLYEPNIWLYLKSSAKKTASILIKNKNKVLKFAYLRLKEIIFNKHIRENDLIYVNLTKRLEYAISKEAKEKIKARILNSKRIKKLIENLDNLKEKFDEIYILTDNPTKTIRDFFKHHGIETLRKNSKRIKIIKEKLHNTDFTLLTDGTNDLRFFGWGVKVIPTKQLRITNRIGVNQLPYAKPFDKCLEELLE